MLSTFFSRTRQAIARYKGSVTRTSYLLALAFVLVGVNTVLTVQSARVLARDTALVGHTRDVFQSRDHLLSLLMDAETGTRGFVFTGLGRFLAPYERALPQIGPEMAQLKRLTADNPRQQQRFPELEKDVASRLQFLATGIAARRATDFSVEDEIVREEGGILVMDDIRAILDRMEQEERQTLATREKEVASSSRRSLISFVLASALDLLLIAFVYRLLWLERTARSQIEAAARRMQQLQHVTDAALAQFRATFNQAAVGMAHVGLDGAWLMVNQRLCDILGYAREELLQLTFQDVTHPEDLDAHLANVKRLLDREVQSYAMEKRYTRKDGAVVYANLNASLLRDSHGAPLYFILAVQDISDKKESEREREHLVRRLINSEKLASAGRMANTLAHEINNPLAAVVNAVYLLEGERSLSDSARSLVQLASRELDRVSGITRTTLSFYRPSSRSDAASVPGMLKDVIQLYSNKARDMKVIVAAEFGDDTTVEAFPKTLGQVFSNLVINALEAMPRGGQLRIRTRRLHDTETGRFAILVLISDNGNGIQTGQRSQIFEPFFTTKGEKGTGLGLWVTRGIVEEYGGSLRLRSSTEGARHGTTVRVILPVAASGAQAAD